VEQEEKNVAMKNMVT
jgi:uncharacterized coiled-coil protein SlyX